MYLVMYAISGLNEALVQIRPVPEQDNVAGGVNVVQPASSCVQLSDVHRNHVCV